MDPNEINVGVVFLQLSPYIDSSTLIKCDMKARIEGITMKKKKKYWQKLTFSYMGAELEKGRNLLAETSGGQIRKGPKPLATVSSCGLRNAMNNLSIRLL